MPPLDLPDINVWLALADENHAHHAAASRYWEQGDAGGFAFCRVTMLGFLRLSTHPKAMRGRPFTASEAWRAYRGFIELPEVSLLPEPSGIEEAFAGLSDSQGFTHPLWTDAYLAAFSLTSGCRTVSFDTDFRRFPGLNFLRLQP